MDVGIGLPGTIAGVGREQLLDRARQSEAWGFSSVATLGEHAEQAANGYLRDYYAFVGESAGMSPRARPRTSPP